jgi:hypothetical protein
MKVLDVNITNSVVGFFENSNSLSLEIINSKLLSTCGINTFFSTQSEIDELSNALMTNKNVLNEPDRSEYGDFQTNRGLSDKICKLLKKQNTYPEIIIEPTCGKGNFIISSLIAFESIKFIYGIEIYKPYVWETKFAILDHFLKNGNANLPEIYIYHSNVFEFDFNSISYKHQNQNVLVIGNPPWVTNSKLSALGSKNLPTKSNFKKHSGFDAITGKGNFDIGEFISIKLLSLFSNLNGKFAFLVKNSVVKNILLEQNKTRFKISSLKQFDIDAKKEFNVSVNACLFYCSLNSGPKSIIKEYNFYSSKLIKEYGWVSDRFVADVALYHKAKDIDGKSPFIWRQGIKHDASKIMELESTNGHYKNNNNDIVIIENDMVFNLLKSSDLKGSINETSRKYTIITQNKIGQDTKYIREQFPKTYDYLLGNIEYFNKRKSSIYKGKPLFSIFGIGDYSFKLFKVAISGLYKTTFFSLVKPVGNKPMMLDDTCYFLGFDTLIEAEITRFLLNKKETQDFIRSIAFNDAKRMITKDLLMRIDLTKIINNTNFGELKTKIGNISTHDWTKYKEGIKRKNLEKNQQLKLFKEQIPQPINI